tara:strand:+ start:2085 stop:3227 length:1143 start_codon:yes stop_codon:yes gene_type:complete
MKELPQKLQQKLEKRIAQDNFRQLSVAEERIDFSSNDYLGWADNQAIKKKAEGILKKTSINRSGATGSRLLTGNHVLYEWAERKIAKIHHTPEALIFNSGYVANLGLLATVPQRGDIIFYDALCHASIREGIALSAAKSYKFQHNNLEDLEILVSRHSPNDGICYLVTESVFSMDGDAPDLPRLVAFCDAHSIRLIIDEAHALGVVGSGKGWIFEHTLTDTIFATVITFGKALGQHGAAILCGNDLKDYLVNFARSFIYTTGLPPHTVAGIIAAYQQLQTVPSEIQQLQQRIGFFKDEINRLRLDAYFQWNPSAIQICQLSGSRHTKSIALKLQNQGYDVRPILAPTVPEGKERLRFCIHAFNTEEEITDVLTALATFVG